MINNRTIIIISVVALIFFLAGAALFKIEKVPDVKWENNVMFNSKEPYGTWAFKELINERFDSTKVFLNYQDTLLNELESTNNLYIRFSNSDEWIPDEEMDSILRFVEKGNDALIIGADFKYYWDSIGNFNLSSYTEMDSVFEVSFEENGEEKTFVYHHYFGAFKKAQETRYNVLDVSDIPNFEPIGNMDECEDYVFGKVPRGEGAVYLHSLFQMFINHGVKQDFYLHHFNACFDRFDPNLVILDHYQFSKFGNYSNIDSPIQYILANKSLSAAYYLLLITSLIFVIFQSKRRQKSIPILKRNNNTSLEYVRTLSNLFASHEKPQMLFPHIKKHFFHSVKMKYYLDEKHPNFARILSKKSRIDEKEIESILKMLSRKNNYSFPRDHLFNLHSRIERFFKNAH